MDCFCLVISWELFGIPRRNKWFYISSNKLQYDDIIVQKMLCLPDCIPLFSHKSKKNVI